MSDNTVFLFGIASVLTIVIGLLTMSHVYDEQRHQQVMHCLEMQYPIEQCVLLNNIR